MYIDITDTSRRKPVGKKTNTEIGLEVNTVIVLPKAGEHKLELDVYTTNREACSILSRYSTYQESVNEEFRFIVPAGLITVADRSRD